LPALAKDTAKIAVPDPAILMLIAAHIRKHDIARKIGRSGIDHMVIGRRRGDVRHYPFIVKSLLNRRLVSEN
jgi:hypothetical protein